VPTGSRAALKNVETLHCVEVPHVYRVFYFHAMRSYRVVRSFQDL